MTPRPPELYTVFVDDNFHYMDESERYQHGSFATLEEAVTACKRIVDEFLESAHEPGMTSGQLYTQYAMFGEDPWISPQPEGGFSARDYARGRCAEHCRAEDGASKTRRSDAPPPELTRLQLIIDAVLARPVPAAEQRQALEPMRSQIGGMPQALPDRSFVMILEQRQDQGEGMLRTTFRAELTPTALRLDWSTWKSEGKGKPPVITGLVELKTSFYGTGQGDKRIGDPDEMMEAMAKAAACGDFALIAYSQNWDRNLYL